MPSPNGRAVDEHDRAEVLVVLRPVLAELVGQLAAIPAGPRARAAGSSGPARRGRRGGRRPAAARASRAASSPPSRYTAPITASMASARIDGRSRPPEASSPLPSSSTDAEVEVGRHLGQRGGPHHRGPRPRQQAFAGVGEAAEHLVGDDQAEHRVAEELEPLVGLRTPGARRTSCGGSGRASSSAVSANVWPSRCVNSSSAGSRDQLCPKRPWT